MPLRNRTAEIRFISVTFMLGSVHCGITELSNLGPGKDPSAEMQPPPTRSACVHLTFFLRLRPTPHRPLKCNQDQPQISLILIPHSKEIENPRQILLRNILVGPKFRLKQKTKTNNNLTYNPDGHELHSVCSGVEDSMVSINSGFTWSQAGIVLRAA